MIVLQGMIAFPFVMIGVFMILFIIMTLLTSIFNYVQPKLCPKSPIQIPFYWPIIISMIIVTYILLRTMTYEGPWIN